MSLTTQEKTILDLLADEIFQKIKVSQDNYFVQNGRYWQGIRIPLDVPENSETLSYDSMLKPHYQKENWSDLGLNLPTKLPLQIEVHQYKTPKNTFGYQVFFRIKMVDGFYGKTMGMGIETASRTHDWTKAPLISLSL